jgi:hypothetical protein
MDALDQPLDALVKQNAGRRKQQGAGKGGRGKARVGGARGGARGAPRGSGGSGGGSAGAFRGGFKQLRGAARAARPQQQQQQQRLPQQRMPQQQQVMGGLSGSTKIVLSNLAREITEDDFMEIFQGVGPISRAVVHYDREGQSLGTGEVTFKTKAAALKAVLEYDAATVNGVKMNVKIVANKMDVVLPVRQLQPMAQIARAVHQQQQLSRRGSARGGKGQQQNGGKAQQQGKGGRVTQKGKGKGGKGKGKGKGGRGEKSSVSQADLDADMDSYHNQSSESGRGAGAGQPQASK